MILSGVVLDGTPIPLVIEMVLPAQGDLAAAEQSLQAAEALTAQERFATHAPWVLRARVQQWLATGNLSAASDWAGRVVFSSETWNPNRKWEFLLLVRVYLARHEYEKAIAALSRFGDQMDRPGDIATANHFLALQAVAPMPQLPKSMTALSSPLSTSRLPVLTSP